MAPADWVAADPAARSAPDGPCAVLFDFDGTLVHQTIDFAAMRSAVLALARRYGIDAEGWDRRPSLEMVATVAGCLEAGRAAAFRREAAEAIEAIEMAAARFAQPYQGVMEALAALAERGYGIGIVTRNCRRAVADVLARHPLVHHVLVTRDDTEHVKPDPRHLYDAAARLGIPAECCLMCGDHPMDVAAGKAAGARTVAVVYAGAAIGREAFVGQHAPDLLLASVTELLHRLPARPYSSPCAGRQIARRHG